MPTCMPRSPRRGVALLLTFLVVAPALILVPAAQAGGAAPTMVVGLEKAASATTLAVTDDTPHFGDEITLTATVSGGSGTPTGTVEFFDGGSSLGIVALTGGEAALATTKLGRGSLGSVALSGPSQAALATSKLGIGVHSITASYGGDSAYNPSVSGSSTVTVKYATTTSLEASDADSRFGDEVTFAATVASGGATPTGTISFYDGGGPIATVALDGSGKAAFAASGLGIGSHSITATYSGNSTQDGSSDSLTVTVDQWPEVSFFPPNPTTGDEITVSVWVDCAAGDPNVLPSLYYVVDGPIGENGSFSYPNAVQWEATRAIGTITFPAGTFAAGTYSVYGYGRDSSFNEGNCVPSSYEYSNSPALTMVVTQAVTPSTATLQASDAAVGFGEQITFTATVSGSHGTPTGTVVFLEGKTELGEAPLEGSGEAALAIAGLGVGLHSIIAAYQGDATNDPSASNAVAVTVSPAPSTLSLAASNPSPTLGEEVTLTATITCPADTPTGTVTLLEDGAALRAAELLEVRIGMGGTAFNTSSLGLGEHAITAAYEGNSVCGPSSGQVEIIVGAVDEPVEATTVVLTVDPGQGPLGGVFTLAATVSPASATGSVDFTADGVPLGTAVLSGGVATLEVFGEDIAGAELAASYGGAIGYASAEVSGVAVVVEGTTLRLSAGSAQPGGEIQIDGAGFAPGSPIELWLASDPIFLGEIVADGAGRFTTQITLPAGISGNHEIRALGQSDGGDSLEAVAQLTIEAATFIPPEELPLTGAGFEQLILLGMLSMIGGAGLLALTRRERRVAPD